VLPRSGAENEKRESFVMLKPQRSRVDTTLKAAVSSAALLVVVLLSLLIVQTRRGAVVAPVSGASGFDHYQAVFSTTNYASPDDDGLPKQTYFEITSGGGLRTLHTGSAASAITDTSSIRHLTGTTFAYYPELALLSMEDDLTWLSQPQGTSVYTPGANHILTGPERDWSAIQDLIDADELQYLGEQTYCGYTTKGARYSDAYYDIDGWYSESEGLRLRYVVSSTGSVDLLEECVTADLSPQLDSSDFEIVTGTVWATHTLSVNEIITPTVIHSYSPLLIVTSTNFSQLRSYAVERTYHGIYSYEFHEWPAGVLDPWNDPVGWMVVQDMEDGSGDLLRIVQFSSDATAPFSRSGLEMHEADGLSAPDPSQFVTTPASSNPIIRDEVDEALARWTDEVGGGRFGFITSGWKDDAYLVSIVEDLVASRP
jgi:hypothetical protein